MIAYPTYAQSASATNPTPQTISDPASVADTVTKKAPNSIVTRVTDKVGNMINSVDVKKWSAKPQRDLMTLAIGGLVGFATGSFLSGLGLLNIEILGIAMIPLASGLAGIYFANEGHFDGTRDLIGW
ncbi:hypothetical protein TI05_10980 [Achromatium sp. WMS3]|nr:hypothetical protein TI05_10980 [Achromatium sp. WMS3]